MPEPVRPADPANHVTARPVHLLPVAQFSRARGPSAEQAEYSRRVERDAHKARSFEGAAARDRAQQQAMSPDERLAIAKELPERVESEVWS